jgi:hypothetical protein
MATMTITLLANGQLAAAAAALYTVPAGTTTIIKTITYVNTSSSQSVNLYVKKAAGTSRKIIPSNMVLGTSYCMLYDDEMTLAVGDQILGDATNANQVDYSVNGVEKT